MNNKYEIEFKKNIAIVTSIHPDFDARIWKHANGLSEAGWKVNLIAPWKADGVEIPKNISLHSFRRVKGRISRIYKIPFRVGRILIPVAKNCDIIHFHDIDLLPWMVLMSFWKKVVYDIHEDYPEEMRIREWIPNLLREPLALFLTLIQWLCCKFIKNIVLVNTALEKEFTDTSLRKIVIPNYATVKLTKSVKDNYLLRKPVVVFIGSQHLNNGSELVLEIAKEVKNIRPEVRFITSDRFANLKLKQDYLEIIQKYDLTNLNIISNVKPHQLMDILNEATIAITPNLRVKQQINGQHNKIYEYMAAALPIIASDLPHQSAVITGADCGILAQPEDPSTFVNAIVRLVDDNTYAYQLGKNAQHSFFDNYSWESQMIRLLKFYNDILISEH